MLDYYKQDEKERLEKNKKRNDSRKQNAERVRLGQDIKAKRALSKKPKVAPVRAMDKNTRKMEKMLKKMSIGQESSKKKKINMQDSSDESSDDEVNVQDVGMQIDQIGGPSKTIQKKKKVLSRSYYQSLKKDLRRKIKDGNVPNIDKLDKLLAQMQD